MVMEQTSIGEEIDSGAAAWGRVTAEFVEITPEIAEEWLLLNVENRNMRRHQVQRLTGAHARGEWVVNGETIKFDWNGALLDGQHRLQMIVNSGKPAVSLVVRGLDPKAMVTIDQGAKKTVGDFLGVSGVKNANNIAAAVTWLHLYRLGHVRHRGVYRPTATEAMELLAKNPAIVDHFEVAYELNQELGVTPSMGQFCSYICAQQDEAAAQEFFEKLTYGENLFRGDTVWHLRRTLQKMKGARNVTTSPEVKGAFIVKGWNAWRQGKFLQVYKFLPSEPFPTAI